MLIQPVSNTRSQHPTFGRMIFDGGDPRIQKAIKKNRSFKNLSKEMEEAGKNLIFSLNNKYGATYMSMHADKTYIGIVAETRPYDINKMVKQVKEYSCEALINGIRIGKELFSK